ncbi:MAG: hypothetical protein NTW85_14730 [Methylococcales bacterium]|nr:hypothetical protein [Methylococcales bacterium]
MPRNSTAQHSTAQHSTAQHSTAQHSTAQHTNIFSQLTEHVKQIEQYWKTIFQGLCDASEDHPYLDIQHFNSLNAKFTAALDRLYSDLQSPTLIHTITHNSSTF